MRTPQPRPRMPRRSSVRRTSSSCPGRISTPLCSPRPATRMRPRETSRLWPTAAPGVRVFRVDFPWGSPNGEIRIVVVRRRGPCLLRQRRVRRPRDDTRNGGSRRYASRPVEPARFRLGVRCGRSRYAAAASDRLGRDPVSAPWARRTTSRQVSTSQMAGSRSETSWARKCRRPRPSTNIRSIP